MSSPCPRRTMPVIINMTIAAILQTVNTICIREAHFTLAQFTNRITAAMKRSTNLSRLKQRLVFYNLYYFHSSMTEKETKRQKKKLCGYLYFPVGSGFCWAIPSLRGRRSKGKGKGTRARDRARGRREKGNFSFLPRALARPNSPFPFPFSRLPRRLGNAKKLHPAKH